MSALSFWVLGELLVTADGVAVRLTAGQQRLLVVLLERANRAVAAEDIIDRLWPRRDPDRTRHLLHTYVSALRRALDPGRHGLVRHLPAGYQLRVEDAQVDALRFLRLLRTGQQCLEGGQPAMARDVLQAALRLWRTPLPALPSMDRASADLARRLAVAWHAAVEASNEARLHLGDHRSLAVELELLVAQQPRNERLVRQLMVSHYRSGNPAAALEAFTACTAALAERGLVPGPELRATELAVVRHDPALAPPADAAPAAPVPPAGGAPAAAVVCVFLSGDAASLAYPVPAEVDVLLQEGGGTLVEAAPRRRVAAFTSVDGALGWAVSVVSGPATVSATAPAAGLWVTGPGPDRPEASWHDVVLLAQRARPGTVAVCGYPEILPVTLPGGFGMQPLDGPRDHRGRTAVLLASRR